MQSLIDYAINEEYAKVKRLGDRLADIEPLIDWEAFRPIVADMFDNRSEKGGRCLYQRHCEKGICDSPTKGE